ncbi:Rpn family recombination-promoting nuclease/putative transposase [Anabaena subtropica]|uniref:Rpn family recombination-promoting nuclease/putative transposase n=1 Tax=Anabaena subtropica FACHB-260 TaxID=2692884 RepID=A0ABR8CW29_9NOST|nr:Rpn family recombination-promoting nuclease/putative transposase [Anabaena subtropica]MBD2346005.1 Rpn family recombination-promoting nuclease/putative transposase [Anabaena subtropica FACHB-260]
MLNVDLIRETKVYQEAFEEGELQAKLKIVPILLELGLSIQQIAEKLKLDTDVVREAARS